MIRPFYKFPRAASTSPSLDATVSVFLPLLTATVGFVTIEGLWHDPVYARPTRVSAVHSLPVPWIPVRGTYTAWKPLERGRS